MSRASIEPIISLHDLDVRLGENHVLKGLTADILQGSTGLLGPNGAGKSTLLRTILAYHTPAEPWFAISILIGMGVGFSLLAFLVFQTRDYGFEKGTV